MLSQQAPQRVIDHMTMVGQLETIKNKMKKNYRETWIKTDYKNLTDVDFNKMDTAIDDLMKTLKDDPKENLQHISNNFYISYKEIGHKMLVENPLTVEKLPEALKKQFVSKDGSKYMLSIYPDFNIWDNLNSEKGKTFFLRHYRILMHP